MSRPDHEVLAMPSVDGPTSSTESLAPDGEHRRPHRPRAARAARGAAAATFSTFVALASHVLAGGAVPGLLGVVVPLVFATSSCIALAGLRRSWVRLSVSVALSQLLFHTLFVIGAASTATVVGGGVDHGAHAGHAVDPTIVVTGAAGGAVAHAGHAGVWMWCAHAVAAAVTVLALQRGETVLTRLGQLAGRLVAVLLLPVGRLLVLPTHPRTALSSVEGAWTPSPLPVVATGMVRRGPPALSSV